MPSNLILHELTLSPNNVKVRIALGYKGLDYERRQLEVKDFPGDRSALVKLSRQPRTPVLQHGDTIIYDSSAILRYLDANFPDSPPIFTGDYAEMGEIEEWEHFARTDIGAPIGMIFEQAFAPKPDPSVGERATAILHDTTARIEEHLSGHDFLVTDHITGADLACAPALHLAMLTPQVAASHPIAAVFHQHLHLGDGREKTRAWIEKLHAFDPAFAG